VANNKTLLLVLIIRLGSIAGKQRIKIPMKMIAIELWFITCFCPDYFGLANMLLMM